MARKARLSSLPVELLDEICTWAQQPPNGVGLSTLSLISRQFCSLARPRLLSHLNIGGFSPRLRRRPAQLKLLSQGDCAASAFAKSLTFDYTLSFLREDPAKVLSPIEIIMHKYFKAAIQLCKKVERVISIVGMLDPPWIHNCILKSLQILPLTELIVCYMDYSNPYLQLGSLCNLRKICIERIGSSKNFSSPNFIVQLATLISQCPNLTHLEVDFPYISIAQLFQVINADDTKPHLSIEHLGLKMVEVTPAGFELSFKHLKALKYFGLHRNTTYIHNGRLPLNNADIWDILRREKIILSTIFTDMLETQGLGLYLQSFHGLKNLHLYPGSQVYHSGHGHSSLSNLLQIVHLQHSSSLVELDIDTTDALFQRWHWPLDEPSTKVLHLFPNLKNFGVTFHSRSFYVSRCQGIEPASVLVKNLLDVSLKSFPKLQQVVIHVPAYKRESHPHFHHGLNSERPQWLLVDVHKAIQAHPIKNHGVNPMPAIKCQGVVYYTCRSLVTGIRSYMPARPLLFEDCTRWNNFNFAYQRRKDQD